MSLRVNHCGEVKGEKPGAVAKASLKRAEVLATVQKSQGLDTKPGELPMDRVKRV